MMKKTILTILAAATALNLFAQQFCSPDGRMQLTLSCEDGHPSYILTYDSIPCVLSSSLGLVLDCADFSSGMSIDDQHISVDTVLVDYSLNKIKKSNVSHKSVEAVVPFLHKGKPAFDLMLHISDNNLAFKYALKGIQDRRCALVKAECTSFVFPEGSTTFLCPASTPMGGWKRTWPSYETKYVADDSMGSNGEGYGFTFPCLFHLPQAWVLVSETGVDGNYCASRLNGDGGARYSVGFPDPAEMNGAGSACPAIKIPGETPWRTITVGTDLAPIVETTIPFDVVKPKYSSSREYVFGRGTWSWIIGMDAWTNYETQIKYIDLAQSLGYESVLIDASWDWRIGRDRIAQLAEYAAGKGIGLFLWYNSNGGWNDAEGSPYDRMDRSRARREEMAWLQSLGIRGVKVDFFGGDKQDMMRLYEDILTDAEDFGLLVIFHGCTLPRGWERMYPNYVASEAVMASENLYFSQQSCDEEAYCATLHPFIRNTVGAMDFGGSALNRRYGADNNSGNYRRTSDVFALATAVLFQSPVQHFALAPNNFHDAPAWAVDFMKNVPSTWEDVKFIDGYPGRYVIMARKSGGRWYVAGVNALEESVETEIDTDALFKGKVRMYADDEDLNGSVKSAKVSGKFKISIPSNGGIVITDN